MSACFGSVSVPKKINKGGGVDQDHVLKSLWFCQIPHWLPGLAHYSERDKQNGHQKSANADNQ